MVRCPAGNPCVLPFCPERSRAVLGTGVLWPCRAETGPSSSGHGTSAVAAPEFTKSPISVPMLPQTSFLFSDAPSTSCLQTGMDARAPS